MVAQNPTRKFYKAAKPSFRHACGRADRILRPRGQGGMKFIVRISKKYNLCHENLTVL
jgi:hypothetical protein